MDTCRICSKGLSGPRVECAVCPHTFLCINCFRKGCEAGDHKSYHEYVIVRDVSVLAAGWTCEEEETLLDSIVSCGHGNWAHLAKYLPNKTKEEVESHFEACYVSADVEPQLRPSYSGMSRDQSGISRQNPVTVVGPCENPPRPSRKGGNIKDLIDYNPARAEFGIEYDNLAERDATTLSGINNPQGDELLTELTLAVISSYNTRLTRRDRARRIVREHGLIHRRKVMSSSLRYQNVKCADWSYKLLARFTQMLSGESMDYLLESLLLEAETKCNILKLQKIRSEGIKLIGSVPIYEQLVKSREDQVRQLSTNQVSRSLFSTNEVVGAESTCLVQLPPGGVADWLRPSSHSSSGAAAAAVSLLPLAAVSSIGSAAPSRRRAAVPLDILGLPGYEKLAHLERQLCSNIRLTPQSFLDVKRVLSSESERRGGLRLGEARTLAKIDVNKTRRVYDFLLDAGDITARQ